MKIKNQNQKKSVFSMFSVANPFLSSFSFSFFSFFIFSLLLVPLLFGGTVSAEPFVAKSAVEKTEVYLGEPLLFQIQVEGSSAPDTPNISTLRDFDVEERGSQNNSSSSVTIINGRMTRTTRHGYIFSYQLTPKKRGRLTIPSFTVTAEGRTARTRPVTIHVSTPVETNDFKLRMALSAKTVYTGQPVIVTLVWYIGKDVKEFRFGMPVLNDSRFDIADSETVVNPNRPDLYVRAVVGDEEIIAKKGNATLNNREYITVSFEKILIPVKAGKITLPQSTVAFNAVMGYQGRGRRSPFGDFFGRQTQIKKFVIPSNEPVLNVKALPKTGQPKNFTGLVGSYTIAAAASPTDVSVGDPITITLTVTGSDYLDNVKLPPLDKQPSLARDFKIPQEMSPGAVSDGVITFTQTIRAKHPDMEQIPSIELPYFDAKKGVYRIAKSRPIPLKVRTTRIVTARDAEGKSVSEETKTELETLNIGIAHNYEDSAAIENQASDNADDFLSPFTLGMTGLPPLLYFLLLGFTGIRKLHRADPQARRSRRAYGELSKALSGVKKGDTGAGADVYAPVIEALRQFLGSKLNRQAGAITYSDIRSTLVERGVEHSTMEELQKLFEEGEAGRFSGTAATAADPAKIVERALSIAQTIDRRVG